MEPPAQATRDQLVKAFTEIPFNRMLGLRLEQIDANRVAMTFAMKEELIGNFLQGILHGGVISSVLDMAGGMVVMATAIHDKLDRSLSELVGLIGKTSTVDLQVSFLRPGRGELFKATADLIKQGKQLSFTRMLLTNETDTLIATASGTYLLK